MNIGQPLLLSISLVFAFRILHKYALQRAIYLVNMELRSDNGNLPGDVKERKRGMTQPSDLYGGFYFMRTDPQ